MLKTLFICAVVSASVAACSTAGPAKPAPTRTAATACPQNPTASRIPARPGECSSVPGRTYTNEDVERTGQTNVAEALQMLDPSITVHH